MVHCWSLIKNHSSLLHVKHLGERRAIIVVHYPYAGVTTIGFGGLVVFLGAVDVGLTAETLGPLDNLRLNLIGVEVELGHWTSSVKGSIALKAFDTWA
jgi:hypothetical protein